MLPVTVMLVAVTAVAFTLPVTLPVKGPKNLKLFVPVAVIVVAVTIPKKAFEPLGVALNRSSPPWLLIPWSSVATQSI